MAINNMVMMNDGGGAGKSVTGLSKAAVDTTMESFNADAAGVLDELTLKLNEVLKKISDNWGTADAVTHVTDNVVPAFKNLEEKVADMVEDIGRTIRNTALQQAADSKNVIEVIPQKRPTIGQLINNIKEQLDNGYIGVYSTLQQEVREAHENLITELVNKLTNLKQHAVENCSSAFTDEGTSNVAAKCDEFIESIKTAINQAFTEVNGNIDELTKSATTFAKEIQSAGLRAAAGAASGVGAGVAAGADVATNMVK